LAGAKRAFEDLPAGSSVGPEDANVRYGHNLVTAPLVYSLAVPLVLADMLT
jgi:hypothetical protein